MVWPFYDFRKYRFWNRVAKVACRSNTGERLRVARLNYSHRFVPVTINYVTAVANDFWCMRLFLLQSDAIYIEASD